MWKIGVVGAGTMGRVHTAAYGRMPHAQVVGIADIRRDAAQALAQTCAARPYASLEAMLAAQEVDVIDVCVPTYLHRECVLRAAAAERHVICEKPLARTLDDAKAMIAACEHADVRLFVAQVVRFFPEYALVKERVDAQALGRVGTVYASRGGVFPTAWEDWYASPELSGSVIVDSMIHDFDFLRWCFGDVRRVFAKSTILRGHGRLDHAFVSLRFASGVIANVEGTWAYPAGFRTQLEIAGDRGLIQHDSAAATPLQHHRRSDEQASAGVAVPASPLLTDPYQRELEHFLDCLQTGAPARVTAQDALAALEVALAALASAQSGRPVLLGGVSA
jgi:predicted dehydrogenase